MTALAVLEITNLYDVRKKYVADMFQGNPEPPFEQKILKELRKWLREMVLLQGYVSLFGGSDGVPQGDRWLIYVTWPQTRWVETTKCFI